MNKSERPPFEHQPSPRADDSIERLTPAEELRWARAREILASLQSDESVELTHVTSQENAEQIVNNGLNCDYDSIFRTTSFMPNLRDESELSTLQKRDIIAPYHRNGDAVIIIQFYRPSSDDIPEGYQANPDAALTESQLANGSTIQMLPKQYIRGIWKPTTLEFIGNPSFEATTMPLKNLRIPKNPQSILLDDSNTPDEHSSNLPQYPTPPSDHTDIDIW